MATVQPILEFFDAEADAVVVALQNDRWVCRLSFATGSRYFQKDVLGGYLTGFLGRRAPTLAINGTYYPIGVDGLLRREELPPHWYESLSLVESLSLEGKPIQVRRGTLTYIDYLCHEFTYDEDEVMLIPGGYGEAPASASFSMSFVGLATARQLQVRRVDPNVELVRIL